MTTSTTMALTELAAKGADADFIKQNSNLHCNA